MLIWLGLAGMLLTIGCCRQPGTKFFSIVTVYNRHKRLSEAGARLYLVFGGIMLVGLAVSFLPKTPTLQSHASSGSSGSADERSFAADTDVLPDPDGVARYQSVLDHLFVTYILANDPMAEGFRDHCNELVSQAGLASTVQVSREQGANALRQCTQLAKTLCSSKSLDPCNSFDQQSDLFLRGKFR